MNVGLPAAGLAPLFPEGGYAQRFGELALEQFVVALKAGDGR
jgi:hypothetical protein